MPPKKASKLFEKLVFYYPKNAADYDQVTKLINSHSGLVNEISNLANYHLLPTNWATKYPKGGEFFDVSFVQDCAKAGELLEEDMYIVSFPYPIPQATREKIAAERKRESVASRAVRSPANAAMQSPKPSNAYRLPQSPRPAVYRAPAREVDSPLVPRGADVYLYRGRVKYTKEDDMILMDYIERKENERIRRDEEVKKGIKKRYPDLTYQPTGQQFWKAAAREELIPNKTWQSMEGRFKKHIRPYYGRLIEDFNAWKAAQPRNQTPAPPPEPIAKKRR